MNQVIFCRSLELILSPKKNDKKCIPYSSQIVVDTMVLFMAVFHIDFCFSLDGILCFNQVIFRRVLS